MPGLFGWIARTAVHAAEGAVHRQLDEMGERNRRALLLGQYATQEAQIKTLVESLQAHVTERVHRQWEAGHRVPMVEWYEGAIGHEPCLIRLFENGDRSRIDFFYGGVGGPMGLNHGHVTIRAGRIDVWLLPGAQGSSRIRLY